MTAAEAIKSLIDPILPGWRVQFGRWDEGTSPDAEAQRFAVIRPAGGVGAELVRRPQLTLALIGGKGDGPLDISVLADQCVEAMRVSAGGVVYLEAGEPVFMATDGGRPVFELAVSAITT